MAKNRGFYLLKESHEKLLGSKLPSNGQVLGVLLHHHYNKKKCLKESANIVLLELYEFWEKARIPTKRKDHLLEKMIKLHAEWTKLKKNKNKRSNVQQRNEERFQESLKDLFDIAHQNALAMITEEQDRQFLINQRKPGRIGVMGGVDQKTKNKEFRALKKLENEETRKMKAKKSADIYEKTIVLSDSSSSDSEKIEKSSEEEVNINVPSTSGCKRKRGKTNIISPSLAAALDRTRTTDRMASYLLTETVKSIGKNPSEFNINRSSIKRTREKHRESFTYSMKEEFKNIPLIVHWDGKLMSDLEGSSKSYDRLAVIVSNLSGQSQLLGVPALKSGTAENIAEAVFTLLQEWDLVDSTIGMSFDTTSVNTGHLAGACIRIEQMFKKELMHFACRHHIMELIMSGIFNEIYGPSSGPNIPLFKKLKTNWDRIDKTRICTEVSNDIQLIFKPVKTKIIKFAKNLLEQNETFRNDYKEFLELSIIYLGEDIPNYTIKKPGAMHMARWMAKVLYSLKMWLFRDQLNLTKRELSCIKEISIFAVKIYLKAWMTAPLSVSAPQNDLKLLKLLRNYHNKQVGKAAVDKFGSHLWYLSEKMIALSLFDPSVTDSEKKDIVLAMNSKVGNKDCPKRISATSIKGSTSLSSLASKNSKKLLDALHLPLTFLEEEPSTWPQNDEFKICSKAVKNISVVNDHAERAVALIQDYSGHHTKNEKQLQYLLKVVAEHRKKYPDPKKSTTGQQ